MRSRSIRLTLVIVALAIWPVAPASAAPLWSAVSTPTKHTITAIAAGSPGSGELVFVTSVGEIFHLVSGTGFVASAVQPPNPGGFSDVALSGDGRDGVAVGRAGALYHSSDAGASWTAVSVQEPGGACPAPGSDAPLTDDLYSVQFADPSTVYATGNDDDVLRSSDGGNSFVEVNKSALGCVADPGGIDQGFTDSAWSDGDHGFLISSDSGMYFSTSDGLLSASFLGNGTDGSGKRTELALDAQDPMLAWAVSHGSSDGASFMRTRDGGSTWRAVSYDGTQSGLRDVSSAGGTVIAVGDGGDIYTSPDGVNFYRQLAPPPNTGTSWRAVALLDSQHAFVGGTGGVLLVGSHVGGPPDTVPPTGSIAGPTHLAPGQRGMYTAHVTDNAAGSGIDQSSLSWTAPGLGPQSGSRAMFSFARAGTYVVTLDFADLAGNFSTAYLKVTVAAAHGHRRHTQARHKRR